MTAQVRDATVEDMAAVCAIANEHISTRTVTWTEAIETVEERVAWFAHQQADEMPVLVATEDETVLGFAAYSSFRDNTKWPGYRFTVELSIHVTGGHHGQGIGRALMVALLDRARAAGMHVMVAAVDGENVESIAFHEALGFREVGRLPEIGTKFGRWLDLVLLQIEL